jgi:hypothetical protein
MYKVDRDMTSPQRVCVVGCLECAFTSASDCKQTSAWRRAMKVLDNGAVVIE